MGKQDCHYNASDILNRKNVKNASKKFLEESNSTTKTIIDFNEKFPLFGSATPSAEEAAKPITIPQPSSSIANARPGKSYDLPVEKEEKPFGSNC